MVQDLLWQIKQQMKKAVDHFENEIKVLRTGRAGAALVEGVLVDYYGTPTPLRQIATITVPDAHTITIQAWDPKAMGDIEQAIRQSDIGLSPVNDGKVVRLNLPPLTAERRTELVKLLHKMGEEARVVLRGIRKEAWESVQKEERSGALTEDDKYQNEEQLNKVIDEFNATIESLVKQKESDILNV